MDRDKMMICTRKDLKNLLKENGVPVTADNKITLMFLAVENNLISKDDIFKGKFRGMRPVGRGVGRPRKEKKEKKEKIKNTPIESIEPKYERLGFIRNNPLGLRITHVETGEVIEYKSTYEATKKTGRSWYYYKNRDGGEYDGYKYEIIDLKNPSSEALNDNKDNKVVKVKKPVGRPRKESR